MQKIYKTDLKRFIMNSNIKQSIMPIVQSTHYFFFITMLVLIVGFIYTDKVNGQNTNVIIPTEPIELFNGEDLSNFYTWLEDGLDFDDPNNVFSVVDRIDGTPAIRVSGENWGGFITEEEYADYHLIVEFRWGEVTYGTRQDRALDSGILLHAQGPEGNFREDFTGPWMRSVEYQMIEGGTGDFILVGGYTQDGERLAPKMKATVSQDYNGQYIWDPDGEVREFEGGRINWYGRDPEWRDEIGFRGMQDVEKPVGEWNRIEAIVDGDTFVFLLNGRIVNKGFDSELTEGKLLFQSEGAEVFFRRIELRPLP
jgi:hypothetical protein